MLVHDTGIAHPEIWQEFLDQQGQDVALCVHCDARHPLALYKSMPLVKDHMLLTRVKVHWGQLSVVDATIQSLKEVLAKHKRAQHVLFCSGSDIPLRLLGQLRYVKKDTTLFTRQFSAKQDAQFIAQTRQEAPKGTVLDTQILAAVTFHHQWLMLCRDHASLLVQHCAAMLQQFRHVQQLLEHAGHRLAPDEWCIVTAIKLYAAGRAKLDSSHQVCIVYVPDGKDHPHQFTNLLRQDSTTQPGVKRSLAGVIQECWRHASGLTLRKVRLSSDAEAAQLLAMLQRLWQGEDPIQHPCMGRKCFFTKAGCHLPNPWIEFRVAHKGLGKGMGQLRREYRLMMQGKAPLLPSEGATHFEGTMHQQLCSHVRQRQLAAMTSGGQPKKAAAHPTEKRYSVAPRHDAPSGLANKGNNLCYFNAVVQLLRCVPGDNVMRGALSRFAGQGGTLADAKPVVQDQLGFAVGEQQDVAEALRLLLQAGLCLRAPFDFTWKVQRKAGNNVGVDQAVHQILQVPLNRCNQLQACLDGLQQPQVQRAAFRAHMQYTEESSFPRPPAQALLIHLKRFNANGSKVTRQITVPETLTFPHGRRWTLAAAILHLGSTLGGGHYVTLGRRNGGLWWKFDDLIVRSMTVPAVLEQASQYGYMLLYVAAVAEIATVGNGVLVRPSTIPDAGNGLFADRDFAKNELITEYEGVEEAEADAKRKQPRDITHHITRKDSRSIHGLKDPTQAVGRGGASFANDPREASRCNARYFWRPDPATSGTTNKVFLKATKDIRKGDEIFVSYGKGYWRRQETDHA